MDCLSQSKAENAEHIHAMISPDEVSNDYGLDDGKESEENYVEPKEGDSKCTEDAMSVLKWMLLTIVFNEMIR
jgi:hypothetical protein